MPSRYKQTGKKKEREEMNESPRESESTSSAYLVCDNAKCFAQFRVSVLDHNMNCVLDRLREETLRLMPTGRPSTAILKSIMIPLASASETSGNGSVLLSTMASLFVKDAHTLSVKVYDADHCKIVERTIRQELPQYPITKEGDTTLYLAMPKWTLELREQCIKQLTAMSETFKQEIRSIRRDAIQCTLPFTQDEKRLSGQEIQKKHDHFIQRIQDMIDERKRSILTS